MLNFVLRAKFSQQPWAKEQFPLAQNYVFYDDLIKQFNTSGPRLSPTTMQAFLNASVPKITRRQNYAPALTRIFKACLPHFAQHFAYYQHNQLFSKILVNYQTLNLHRKQVFNLVQKSILSIDSLPHKHSHLYYFTMVDLHHQENPELKRSIKQKLFKDVTHQNFVERNPRERNHLMFAVKVLNLMLLDEDLDLKQCQAVIDAIEKNIFPTVKNVSFLANDSAKNFALAKELIQLHKLTIRDKIFYNLLDSGLVFFIESKMQQTKPVTRKENYRIELKQGKEMEFRGSKVGENKNQINHGMSSIFETIFARCLEQLGYKYKKNAFIGMYEYDFLITGRKHRQYRPFEGMGEKGELKAITSCELQGFRSMGDWKNLKVEQKWQSAMVLNLNGPYHYIDSDVYGGERMTRTDEMKMMLLQNYGYTRFNQVHYAEWEEVHERGIHVEQFISKLTETSLLTAGG